MITELGTVGLQGMGTVVEVAFGIYSTRGTIIHARWF